jgi:4-amino-4-deoxy-L-arabinose transferase-like glycosyltransferase
MTSDHPGLSTPLIIAVLLGLGALLTIGATPLFDLDEGAFSQASLEMLQSGEYAATTLNGEPRYDKPVGVYWLQAASVALFGAQTWAFRLPSVLAGLVWAVLIWRFAREQWSRQEADWAALIMLSTLGASIIIKAAIADALLQVFLTLSLLDIYRYTKAPSLALKLRVYLWMGLGFLVKGPVAVVIPACTAAVFLASQRRWKLLWQAMADPRGWAVFAAAVCPWLVAVYQAQGWDFFVGFFGEHNFGRFTSTREGHGGQWWYYFWALPLVLLPFAALILIVLRRAPLLFEEHLPRFLLIWFGVVFTLVSLSATQLPHYVLYGAAPLYLLCARQLCSQTHWPWVIAIAALWTALISLTPVLLPILPLPSLGAYEQGLLERARSLASAKQTLVAGGLVLTAGALWVLMRRLGEQSLAGLAALHWLSLHLFLLPWYAQVQQAPVRNAGLLAREVTNPIVMYGLRMPSFAVYAGRPTEVRAPRSGDWVLARVDRKPPPCAEGISCTQRLRQGGITLWSIDDAQR